MYIYIYIYVYIYIYICICTGLVAQKHKCFINLYFNALQDLC